MVEIFCVGLDIDCDTTVNLIANCHAFLDIISHASDTSWLKNVIIIVDTILLVSALVVSDDVGTWVRFS